MPIYLFEHPDTGETIEVVQSMSDDHTYVDDNDLEWNRVWTTPSASIDANVDPFNEKAWMDKTGKQTKGNFGDLFDQAKEASEKRKDKLGFDPVKQKYLKNWSEKRQGKKHPESYE